MRWLQIGEDEFFDAVEDALDKLQEEQDYRDKMKLMSLSSSQKVEMMHHQSEASQHQLWPTIDKVTDEKAELKQISSTNSIVAGVK